ncbi:Lysosomal Pro-X carboxypeptidase [Ananas comosus]|uniref:Lysosomal Pro-X carboxypeptidase n=1 Tax=Ananas comosus TaxID=4615 RepID=A0A199UTY7_ANACO|nr:Lysosomal Pro-X carboxypeptidase [Ananas comosus]
MEISTPIITTLSLLLFSLQFPFSLSTLAKYFPTHHYLTTIHREHGRVENSTSASTASSSSSSSSKNAVRYEKRYFTQRLDHFNFEPQGFTSFQQKFLVNDTHWGGASAPIFVYAGNEGRIEWFAENTGYYGESLPYGSKDVAYNKSLVGYLTTTQALADYAALILDLKNNLSSQSSPVVLFGGSYGGMLAAWFRLKYPHVAIGALASSAPILQFDGLCSPYSFYDIVTRDFKRESENCYEVIKRSWKEMDDAINKGVGIRELKRAFNICKLYGAVNIYYNYSGNVDCFALHDDDPHDTLYGWDWQSCSELLLAVGGVSNSSMFPPSRYNFTEQVADCQESNEGIPPKPHWITTEFGGFDIKRTLKRFGSNIIFFNGLRDPWSGGGVLESLSESLIAIAAHKGAHHVDLRFSTNEDPKWLTEIREKEVQIIKKWLTEYYRDSA